MMVQVVVAKNSSFPPAAKYYSIKYLLFSFLVDSVPVSRS